MVDPVLYGVSPRGAAAGQPIKSLGSEYCNYRDATRVECPLHFDLEA